MDIELKLTNVTWHELERLLATDADSGCSKTPPRKREPLTVAQFVELAQRHRWNDDWWNPPSGRLMEFLRAVEAAHGIGY